MVNFRGYVDKYSIFVPKPNQAERLFDGMLIQDVLPISSHRALAFDKDKIKKKKDGVKRRKYSRST
ncbi:hypothetical protein D8674_029171 [Pyrus ussuriensis x Pyrus communis]|uniref:Uncharacterized protein n=1 Tax=Pyrus ussuriensis x Pyrus communis TaxID=2448454 RepID=A0A5N5IBV7_9ROSA|nr:hypothetical protein D8674_029171 [Pyrus ussuriensis x Pyrus communis]